MNTLPETCIYCPGELSAATRKAHVVPNAIGGRIQSRRIVCNNCNNGIGDSERRLIDALAEISGPLGIIRGDNEAHPPARFEHPEFDTIRISAGKPVRSTAVEQVDTHTVTIKSDNYEQIGKLVAHQLIRYKKTPADIESGTVSVSGSHEAIPLGTMTSNVNIGPEHYPAIVKMALELLAYHRPELARRAELFPALRFARHGEGQIPVKGGEAWKAPPVATHAVEKPPLSHSVEVWSHGAELFARVLFFRHYDYYLRLSESWNGGPVTVFHVVDPIKGAVVANEAADHEGPPLEISNLAPAPDLQILEARQRFSADINRRMKSLAYAEATDATLEQWSSEVEYGKLFDEADAARIAQLMAARVAEIEIPRRKELGIDRETLIEAIKRHYEALTRGSR